MSGLFNFLTNDDPNAQAQLAMAAGLLGGRGSFNQILGSSLMGGQRAGAAAGAIKRQAALDDLARQRFQLSLTEEERKAKQTAAQRAALEGLPEPQDPLGLAAHRVALAGGADPLAYIQSRMPVPPKRTVVGRDQRVFEGDQEVIPALPKDEDDPISKLLRAQAKFTPGSPQWLVYQDAIKKASTHQEPVSINNYGSPLPVQLPGGGTGYIQPPSRPGGPSQILNIPGTDKPAIKPTDAKEKDLTEAQAKATTLLGQMRSASAALTKLGMDQSALSFQAETALAGGAMNVAIAAKAQQVRQTQDQWSEAFLRFKTGAATTKDEVANNRKTFFPVIGDKPETIELKKQMRAQAEKDMEIAAGRGAAQLNLRDAPKNDIRSEADRIIGAP